MAALHRLHILLLIQPVKPHPFPFSSPHLHKTLSEPSGFPGEHSGNEISASSAELSAVPRVITTLMLPKSSCENRPCTVFPKPCNCHIFYIYLPSLSPISKVFSSKSQDTCPVCHRMNCVLVDDGSFFVISTVAMQGRCPELWLQ